MLPRQATRPTLTDLKVAPASEEVVKARDKAILDALRLRPWPQKALFTVMPEEPTLSVDQKEAALHSALIRLRAKRLVVCAEGIWRMAS